MSEKPQSVAVPQRWKCVCAYDGTAFAGWQSQQGGGAIQDVIEERLRQIFGTLIRTHASGRTDAGVHAHGQVFHFDVAWRHGKEKLKAALCVGLPQTIQIKSVDAAKGDFHARFSATGKIYKYHLYLGDADPFLRPFVWSVMKDLDLEAMKRACAVLQGKHDFRALSALNGPPKDDTVRDLRRFEFSRRGRTVCFHAEADGFMYKMVRSLVGAVVAVGEGKLSAEKLKEILVSRQRTPHIQTAPAQGLFLFKVLYR
jgi:tRNA pseudouridine38-40 synthase